MNFQPEKKNQAEGMKHIIPAELLFSILFWNCSIIQPLFQSSRMNTDAINEIFMLQGLLLNSINEYSLPECVYKISSKDYINFVDASHSFQWISPTSWTSSYSRCFLCTDSTSKKKSISIPILNNFGNVIQLVKGEIGDITQQILNLPMNHFIILSY